MQRIINKINKKPKGFSMVELAVTLAIAGILLGYAIPSYRDFGLRQNIRNQTNNLVLDINFAKVMAVKYGQVVVIKSKSGLDWSDGWEIYIDADSNYSRDGVDVLLRDEDKVGASLTLTADNTAYMAFDNLGSAQLSGVNNIVVTHSGIAGNVIISVALSGLVSSKHSGNI